MSSKGQKSPRSSSSSITLESSATVSNVAQSVPFKERYSKLPPISGPNFGYRKHSTQTTTSDSRRTSAESSVQDADHRKSLPIPQPWEDLRRKSVPFPVTAWLSRRRQTPETPETDDLSPKDSRSLKISRSNGDIELPKSARRLSTWKVSMLVSKAKKKFATRENSGKRRISLSDFVRVAIMKKPEAEKKRLIRDLKRKALQHKVCFFVSFVFCFFFFGCIFIAIFFSFVTTHNSPAAYVPLKSTDNAPMEALCRGSVMCHYIASVFVAGLRYRCYRRLCRFCCCG